ncbi:MAG: chitobiase/beta-hexosaminidase C-terminal domain-containing protein [Caryophanon sp.]|nr:chitobiase/beta-hexosaminidase C-terminal domain-containing protein [Caryophanon sp.]
MKKKGWRVATAGALVLTTVTPAMIAQGATVYMDDLVISEYVEGSSNNKAIEIYNGTGAAIDLSAYTMELYTNAGTTPNNTLSLSGTLAHGETKVFVNSQANDVLKPLGEIASITGFNGDDTIVLKKGDAIIDSLGEIAAQVNYAVDFTYVRNADNYKRDTNPNDAVDLSGWTKHPKDTFSYLGSHEANHGRDLAEGSVSIADALAAETDAPVQTEGTLIGFTKNSAYIYDGDKAIAIYPRDALADVAIGSHVIVAGKRATFNGLPQLSNAALIQSEAGVAVKPKIVEPTAIGADVLGQLVTIENVTIAQNATDINKAIDGVDNVIVRDEVLAGVTAGTTYDSMTGIVVVYNGTYQLVPRSSDDIVATQVLETISIAEARAQKIGPAQIKGVITAVIGQTVHIQDDTAGIVLYGTLPFTPTIGQQVEVSGNLLEYRNLLEMDSIKLMNDGGMTTVPAPKVVEAVDESLEGQLVEIQNVVVGEGSSGNFNATMGDNAVVVRDATAAGITANTTYDRIIGVVQQYNDTYQVLPRSRADVIEDASVVQQVAASASGLVTKGTAVTLSTTTDGATIYYTIDGSEPTTASTPFTEPIVVNDNMTIRAIAVKEGLSASSVSDFTYDVFDGALQIHHIQGQSHTSPMKGQQVTNIEGIVTYTFKIGSSHYAVMQTPDEQADDNPNTAEGIFAYLGNNVRGVKVGDHLRVSGNVDEYKIEGNEGDLLSTQINASNGTVEVVASGVTLPAPVAVTEDSLPRDVIDNDNFANFDPKEDAIDYWESLEGMRVSFSGVKATAPQAYGDISGVLDTRVTDTANGGVLITASDYNADRIHIKAFKVNGNAATDFDVATGDTFKGELPLIGVVGYGFSNYKVYMDEADLRAVYKSGGIAPEKTTIVKNDSKLTIANYNIENFSANVSKTSDAKVKLIAESFVNNMESPDIIGIVEMQDNDGETASNSSAANESYERLIAAIEAAGGPTYEYVNIDPVYNQDGGAPGANIRPGFLYNPERVTLKEGTAGDATTAVTYKDGELSHNPGLVNPTDPAFTASRKPIAAQFTFNGEDVFVIGNHFNSKSGDTALFAGTQPPNLVSEAQRIEIAKQLAAFVQSVQADNPKANIVALGDFNDFEFSAPLQVLEETGLANMINELPRADRYTYTYQGNSQVLDHIFVSEHLRTTASVDALHINADYSSVSGKRASDHDPVIVQLDLHNTIDMPKLIPFTLNGKQTGKLIITKPNQHVHVSDGFTIKHGIVVKGNKDGMHVRLTGALSTQTVTLEAKFDASFVVDFAEAVVKEVIITGAHADKVQVLRDNNVGTITK